MQSETMVTSVGHQTEKSLLKILAADESVVRANLANLRQGVGKRPGDDPRLWGILLSDLPDKMLGKRGKPSYAEWAIYTSLTLYALHQQGKDPKKDNVNLKGISLGSAAARLVTAEGNNDDARERVSRRFHQVALAPDMPSMAYYLRSFVQLLRAHDIKLDYVMLAKDLYRFQHVEWAPSVRLQWGQDFYHVDINN